MISSHMGQRVGQPKKGTYADNVMHGTADQRRKGAKVVASLTYKALTRLASGKTKSDPAVRGLRYRCIAGRSGGRARVYAEWRYIDPLTGNRVAIPVGRLPTVEELPPNAFGQVSARGAVVHRPVIDHVVLEPFRQAARECHRKLLGGLDPKSEAGLEGFTVRQAFDLQLQHCRTAKRSDATFAFYEACHKHLKDWFAVLLRKISPTRIRERHQKIGRSRGPVIANGVMRTFRAAWYLAKGEDPALPDFPRLTPFAEPKRRPKLTEELLSKWFAEVSILKHPRRNLYLIGVLTGLRKGDLSSIKQRDIDVRRGILHVPNPKGGQSFDLPLSVVAVELMKQQMEIAGTSPWLFPAATGGGHIIEVRPEPGEFSMSWTPHDLRRVYISAATAAGVHPYLLKLLVNHSVPKSDVTAGYLDASLEVLRREQEKVTDYLRKHGLPL
jgi:integrase